MKIKKIQTKIVYEVEKYNNFTTKDISSYSFTYTHPFSTKHFYTINFFLESLIKLTINYNYNFSFHKLIKLVSISLQE